MNLKEALERETRHRIECKIKEHILKHYTITIRHLDKLEVIKLRKYEEYQIDFHDFYEVRYDPNLSGLPICKQIFEVDKWMSSR